MSTLEQRLREAFTSDLDPVDLPKLVADVRRGVRRRRTRRTTAVAAGAVAALIASVGIGASLLGGPADKPDPAPSPTQTATDTAPAPGVAPRGPAMAADGVGGTVWVTVRERACVCSVLWRHDTDGWTRLFEYPNEFVERLAFAANGRDGLAANVERGGVWATHDGGRTWSDAQVPAATGRLGSFLVDADATWTWATSITDGSVWRSPVGSTDWQRFDVPGTPREVHLLSDAVVVDTTAVGEGNTTSVPVLSEDDGATWQDLPFPCSGENRLYASDGSVFALCAEGQRVVVHRSTGPGGWHEFGRVSGWVLDAVPLAVDRILIRTSTEEVVVTEKEAIPIDTGLGTDASAWDSAAAGDTVFLTTTDGVLVSTDQGLTWDPAG